MRLMDPVRIGVIGGSGLYRMAELNAVEEHALQTPFGRPSDAVLVGTLAGQRVAFIPRHGRGHVHNPSEVPYRANIYALKQMGVQHVIAVSACGSLREAMAPGHVVIPDQLVDRTLGTRDKTFFEDGLVAHVSTADPFCPSLSVLVADAVAEAGGSVHRGGTFVTVEGPRFSTRAESELFRQWGMDIIGMTTTPEAFLAREAELCFAVMAHVTDYDVWHATEEAVSVAMVLQTLQGNLALAQQALIGVVERLAAGEGSDCECGDALATAQITDRAKIPPEAIKRLHPIVGRYFD
ncbi:MAG: S-methyl-5'-thioadenosine phosphorylase [Chloroflexi bacterium]|nr:S-methyl-5'-thioadenosine phosphorylase [Chloroflexota bacterium]